MNQIYRVSRDLQSRFGFALDAKAALQRTLRRVRKRPFEPEFKLLSLLDVGPRCVIDAGSNRGQSIDAIRLFLPDVRIHAFEPNAALFRKLERRLVADSQLQLHNFGLGDKEATSPLYVPFYRNFMYDGLASFDRQDAASWLNSETVWNFKPNLLRIEQFDCVVKTLDDLKLDPAFIKIDVQGFEEAVLTGGSVTLDRHRPVVLLENNDPADRWLRARGWTRFGLIEGKFVQDGHGPSNSIYLQLNADEHVRLRDNFT